MDTPITLRMALTVKGDEIAMDFAGTDAQVDRAINCALCYTYAMAMYGVKVCTSPNLPNNEGAWRPITLSAPEGCIVNPQFPASGGSRMLIGHYLPMLVFGCLGQVVPERVMAACGSPMWGMNQSGVPGKAASPTPTCSSTTAAWAATARATASPACPGPPTSPRPRSRSASTSRRCASITSGCAPDSGGPGRHRGGLGPGDPDREPQRDADRRLLPRGAHPLPGLRHRRRQGRRAGELRINGEQDRSEAAVRRAQGRHGLARHAGRRRPRRSAEARSGGAGGRHRGGLRDREGDLLQLTRGFRKLMALRPAGGITCALLP